MPRNFSVLVVCFQLIILVQCAKRFHLGRSKGGNLGAPVGIEVVLPPEQWFVQKLDHFSPTDMRTWKQRYFVNESFYNFNNPGPIFLMIGGEGPANAKWLVQGAWIEYAKQFNALCIQLEHRYYGKSHPTMDLSTKNLIYLSSHQALADLANFISAMNDKYKFNREVKWIAFGGSYPGSLAAWLRLKYPHLVHAAISSSGPLLAKVNFMEYFQVVVNALREKTGDEDCVTQVKLAHQQIETMIKADPATIEKEFKLCKPFSKASKNDMMNFYNSIADDFADLVQYNEDNRIGQDMKRRTTTINSVCRLITKQPTKPAYKKLAEFNSIVLKEANETCLDYDYDNMIDELRNVSWASEGGRQWMYQTCTEFGFYQTSSGEMEVFGNQFPLDFFIQQCQDVFGPKFDSTFVNAGAEWTNKVFGGLNIAAGRVAYVHGSVDPWHALGMTTTQDNDAPAIFIEDNIDTLIVEDAQPVQPIYASPPSMIAHQAPLMKPNVQLRSSPSRPQRTFHFTPPQTTNILPRSQVLPELLPLPLRLTSPQQLSSAPPLPLHPPLPSSYPPSRPALLSSNSSSSISPPFLPSPSRSDDSITSLSDDSIPFILPSRPSTPAASSSSSEELDIARGLVMPASLLPRPPWMPPTPLYIEQEHVARRQQEQRSPFSCDTPPVPRRDSDRREALRSPSSAHSESLSPRLLPSPQAPPPPSPPPSPPNNNRNRRLQNAISRLLVLNGFHNNNNDHN